MTREIPLTKGQVALVDDEDYTWAASIRWQYSATGGEGRQGYAISRPGSRKTVKTVYMHRVIAGARRGEVVDHIDGDKLNNRRSNLRPCSHTENARNRPKTARNTSGFKGVKREGRRWIATIRVEGRQRRVGAFDTVIEGARAYDIAAIEHYGEFARLNFSPERDWLLPHQFLGAWPGVARGLEEGLGSDDEPLEPGPPNLDLFEARP